ncbi:MAG: flavin reductase [Elusimicrobiaceae bacterium]|nr:flavin reductase [Elusimicrobiaceae bacterium]
MDACICQSLNEFSYGLYIVTAADGETKNGLIVNTAFQVSADPAKIAVCVCKNSFTHDVILKSNVFAVMPLEQEAPMVFIGNFGFRTGRNFDKFAKVSYTPGQTGSPIVREHTLSCVEARVEQTIDVGTHTLFIGNVVAGQVFKPQGTPLTYAYYHTVIKGKTPAGATHL